MMGSRAAETPDALTGLLALIGNPDQAKAKLEEILLAKGEIEKEKASLRADQATQGAYKADLDALAGLLDKREKAVKRRETEADSAKAKNAEESKALDRRAAELDGREQEMQASAQAQAGREAEHAAKVATFEDDCAARCADILKQEEAVADKMRLAEQAEADALELKRNYEQKLAALAAIVKGA